MSDDKRLLRQLKRSIKQSGNRKRRRFLKDISTDPEDFALGRDSSVFLNEPRQKRDRGEGEETEY